MSEKRIPLKVTFDPEANAAYIYLVDEIRAGEVANTYACNPIEVGGMINLDFDEYGKLLGIEVLDAGTRLAPSLLP